MQHFHKTTYLQPTCETIHVRLSAGVLEDNYGVITSASKATRPEDSASKRHLQFEEHTDWAAQGQSLWDKE